MQCRLEQQVLDCCAAGNLPTIDIIIIIANSALLVC